MNRMVLYSEMAEAVKTKRRYTSKLRDQQAVTTRTQILDAARRLLAAGTYSSVTMADIAKEAGVAYQTVYGIFGTKVRLAETLIATGFSHIPEAMKLFDRVFASPDPEDWFRITGRVTRMILEPCSDLVRFISESGDPGLLAGYAERERGRYAAIVDSGLAERLKRSGRLRQNLTPSEAVAVIWAMSGADLYNRLVFERGWTADRYEEWLTDALTNTILESPPPAAWAQQ